MNLTLIPLAKSTSIKVILEGKGEKWEEIVPKGEEVVKALDNLFKKAKINITFLGKIRVLPEEHASLISLLLAHTIQKSLTIAKKV